MGGKTNPLGVVDDVGRFLGIDPLPEEAGGGGVGKVLGIDTFSEDPLLEEGGGGVGRLFIPPGVYTEVPPNFEKLVPTKKPTASPTTIPIINNDFPVNMF